MSCEKNIPCVTFSVTNGIKVVSRRVLSAAIKHLFSNNNLDLFDNENAIQSSITPDALCSNSTL